MLSNFQIGDHALLQSFLVGQPELRLIMRSAHMQQLRQRVIASYHLGPMDRQETEEYVKHRLTHVGWSGDPEFDEGAFDSVFQNTSGVPRRINTLCNRVMLSAYLSESHLVSATDIESVVVEIKEELGDDIPPGTPLTATDPVFRAMRGDNFGLGSGSSLDTRALLSGDDSGHGTNGSRPVKNMESRLERLEKAMAAALSALHRLVKPDPPQGPPRAPDSSAAAPSTRRVDIEL